MERNDLGPEDYRDQRHLRGQGGLHLLPDLRWGFVATHRVQFVQCDHQLEAL